MRNNSQQTLGRGITKITFNQVQKAIKALKHSEMAKDDNSKKEDIYTSDDLEAIQ